MRKRNEQTTRFERHQQYVVILILDIFLTSKTIKDKRREKRKLVAFKEDSALGLQPKTEVGSRRQRT